MRPFFCCLIPLAKGKGLWGMAVVEMMPQQRGVLRESETYCEKAEGSEDTPPVSAL